VSYAYRFGPPAHELIVATLRDPAGAMRAQAFHFVLGLPHTRERDLGLSGETRSRADGGYDVVVRSRRLAQSVSVDVDGFTSDDNYFHVAPGGERHLVLRRTTGAGAAPAGAPHGALHALNAEAPALLVFAP
jgi:beta-mannosidase